MIDRAFATDYVAPPAVVPAAVTQVANHTFFVTAGNAAGGNFTLTVDGTTSGPIAFDASAATIEAALTGATVTGAGPWTVVFNANDPVVSIDGAALTRGVSDACCGRRDARGLEHRRRQRLGRQFHAQRRRHGHGRHRVGRDRGRCRDGSLRRESGNGHRQRPARRSLGRHFTTAPTAVNASFDGLTRAATGEGVGAAATYEATVGSATGGTFTVTVDGTTSAAIAWNATAAEVEAALTGASVSGSTPWVIVFANLPTTVTLDDTNLTQPAAPLVPVFVVVPTAMPAGNLTEFQSWNQATPGGAPSRRPARNSTRTSCGPPSPRTTTTLCSTAASSSSRSCPG